jgi:hypothetical protein
LDFLQFPDGRAIATMANFGADSTRYLEIVSIQQLIVNQGFGAVSQKGRWTRCISFSATRKCHEFCARSGLLQRPARSPLSVAGLIIAVHHQRVLLP